MKNESSKNFPCKIKIKIYLDKKIIVVEII